MRHYGIVCPQFWTGRTGRALRDLAKRDAAGKDAQRVALYLMTSPHANMIGLYFLPLLYLCEEVGIDTADAKRAIETLSRLEFSFYDQEAEYVWVKEMARFQVGPTLHPKDGRVAAINRLYQTTPSNRWLGPFFDRYASAFHLTTKRESATAPLDRGALGGAPRPPILICSDPDPVPVLVGSAPDRAPCGNCGQPATATEQKPGQPAATPEWIIERWNKIPGVTPFEKEIQGEIRKRLEARLKERKSQAWWEEYFSTVARADWLCGRNDEGWSATLMWALGPINMSKVLGGYYDRKAQATINGHRGSAPAKPGCNYYPATPCLLHVTASVGNERRCLWHAHLDRHPELEDSFEVFQRFWTTIREQARFGLSAEAAWSKTPLGRRAAGD